MFKDYKVKEISRQDTLPFIKDIHYAKRVPSISYSYGLFKDEQLVGVCTFGKPVSNCLCEGVCGKDYKQLVWELNRLVLKNNNKNEASFFIGKCLKMLPKPLVVVSYADTQQNHLGIVYQATNWLFTGTTRPRTDIADKEGKHPRHHSGDSSKRVFRSAKHRYIQFLGTKKEKKFLRGLLKYEVLPYPKNKEV